MLSVRAFSLFITSEKLANNFFQASGFRRNVTCKTGTWARGRFHLFRPLADCRERTAQIQCQFRRFLGAKQERRMLSAKGCVASRVTRFLKPGT